MKPKRPEANEGTNYAKITTSTEVSFKISESLCCRNLQISDQWDEFAKIAVDLVLAGLCHLVGYFASG